MKSKVEEELKPRRGIRTVASLAAIAAVILSALSMLKPCRTCITLKWNQAHQEDTIDRAVLGLQWALSFLGATTLDDRRAIRHTPDHIFLDTALLGFDDTALDALRTLHRRMKESAEYQANSTLDLGRYVTLLLGSSEHYYRIVGIPEQIEHMLSAYTLEPDIGFLNNSSVSKVHRIIRYSKQQGFNQLFIAQEVDPTTREVREQETIELMPNGHVRFGIFDPAGHRIPAASPTHSDAGKPANCMWCHESSILPLFTDQVDVEGFLPAQKFQNILTGYQAQHALARLSLSRGVDFREDQQHTLTELLYISFMEPSAERLSLEWGLPLENVRARLAHLSTHRHHEFRFLGDLYHREDVEALAPFQGLPVSSSVREKSTREVNYLEP